MTEQDLERTLSIDDASQAWDLLSDRVQAFIGRWDRDGQPPPLAEFLPEHPAALRQLTLVELVKVDLERRWRQSPSRETPWHKLLEAYTSEFPELIVTGGIPSDLIYEEFQIRKLAGEPVTPQQYLERFPNQATELKRLLSLEGTHGTTALVAAEAVEQLDVDQRIDDFDLLSRLGKGAFASVFLARQRSLGRMVALKISADRGFETQTLAQLDHPCIVRVYDQRRLPERRLRLMYMQYVPGGTLQGVVDKVRRVPANVRRGSLLLEVLDESLAVRGETPPADSRMRHRLSRMSWPEAVCWLGSRLASALDYAHQQGVLHRDLKPANILLAADALPKLADFNISFSSKAEGSTAAAYFGGSLAYMSPEQLEACNPMHDRKPDELDARSDIYSLGVVLWELLTGRRPFRDEELASFNTETLDQMAKRRREGLEESAQLQLPADCPPGLVDVLLTCLAPQPEDRFARGNQLARQLEICLQPQVLRLLHPGREGWLPRLRRWPLAMFIIAGVIPNVIACVLNIVYNMGEILQDETLNAERVREVFTAQVMIVNPVAYTVAITVLMWLGWPVMQAVRRRVRGERLEPLHAAFCRRRCLVMGDYVAWFSGIEWLIAGVVFPVWLHMAGIGLEQKHYLHFLASMFLCGLMASTLAFFFEALLMSRVFCPLLVDQETDDPQTADAMARLSRRTSVYFFMAVAVPSLALILMFLLETRSRNAFLVQGIVGMIASYVAFRMSREIQRDATTLQMAMNPEATGAFGTETSDSVWTISR